MKSRIITGVLGGLAFVYAIVTGGIFLDVVTGLLLAIGIWEYNRLARAAGIKTSLPLLLCASLLYFFIHVISVRFKHRFALVDYTGLILFFILLGTFLFRDQDQGLEVFLPSVAANLFGLVYPGVLLTYIILIRGISTPFGWQVLLFMFITIWGNDTGAYFIGSFLGKTPLAPKISPHKTVEGSVGGLLIGTLAGISFGLAFRLPWCILAFSPLIGLVGQIGDLFESLLKRGAGVKDSGWILPGHGGVLDRFDSAMLSLPLVYFLISLLTAMR
ncbi:MAG TPA: phosphatidate cytidylyltransferase [Bacillota bacterium]